jgi:hypothetical protein
MGGERASSARRRLNGKVCCACGSSLPPPHVPGELDKHIDKTKKPYAFKMRDDAPFAFARLWDAWKEPGGDWLQSYSLITTDANELAADVIDRMPVILHPNDYD